MKRVVVTGMAGLCPLGQDWETVRGNIRGMKSGIVTMPQWDEVDGMLTRLAGPVQGFSVPEHYPRKKIRTMGRVALLAARSTELALQDAGLLESPQLTDGTTGVSFGSTSGSPPAMEEYCRLIYINKSIKGVSPVTYIHLMSHTCAANLGQFFGIKGRVVTTCSACTAGSQGIGYAYEAVKFGKQAIMVGGGAEELHVIDAVVFDIMYATSTKNSAPHSSPRPFDKDRDGLVVGEGSGTLILEELEHARARGATILAELVGFGTNCDGVHITNPATEGMERAMRLALADAGLDPSAIGYVNAHGTATELGDIAESQATYRVFGERMPVSSLKSYMGHTLGACGALEAWISVQMLREGWIAPTLNLESVDPRCGKLDYVVGGPRELQVEYIMSNNFAFGGVNTSLIFKRWR
ncbi:MAG: beta-ketoacyl-ACP synthase II [Elusimicrobia bacterium GWA2_69_24]|nr:MAG: beta-ketoacyl-ACP synthase II [Elusimicrobia bacterium GWA2_69_24]HBL16479.1 beta-ketoacyl-ACP synthase [Elusimicrobiota bacterium]